MPPKTKTSLRVTLQPPYTWTLRHPHGYGATPSERLTHDLAKVINAHSLENVHDISDIALARYLVDCLEARRKTLEIPETRELPRAT